MDKKKNIRPALSFASFIHSKNKGEREDLMKNEFDCRNFFLFTRSVILI
jgi:hypothetical protein